MTKNRTVQQKMDELRELVSWFDGDDFSLELAKEKFQAAGELAPGIERDLTELENEVTIIKDSFQTTTP